MSVAEVTPFSAARVAVRRHLNGPPRVGRVTSTAIAACFALTACTVGPNYRTPETGLPSTTDSYGVTAETAWWEEFRDPILNALIEQAADANPSVQQAIAAVAGARAQIAEARAGGMPQLSASLGATDARNFAPPGYLSSGSGSAGFDASWEIDLWGKQRRTVEAAEDNAQAAQAAADAAALTLRGEVARRYIVLRVAQAVAEQFQAELATARFHLHVASTRQTIGDGTDLEKLQAQFALLSVQSRLPSVQATIETNIHALAALCGTHTLPVDLAYHGKQPTAPLPPDAGVPADLLRRRPDVRQAERQLAQATAEIGVAVAGRLPSLSLLGSVGISGNVLDKLLAFPIFAVGTSLKTSLLDGGAATARIAASRARAEAALWSYREAVATAVKDVQDSLSNLAAARNRLSLIKQQVAVGKRTADVAVEAFRIGLADFTTIISVQQTLNQASEELLQARADEAIYLVALEKALGGGYEAGAVARLASAQPAKAK